MPWCPKCGAEYGEGVQECSRCGVPLADERPELPRPRLRQRLPPFLLRRWDEVKRALGYAVEAVRVLRRHPSLLWVGLAFATFNAIGTGVGQYLTFAHTDWGRQFVVVLREAYEGEGGDFVLVDPDDGRVSYYITLPPWDPAPTVSLGYVAQMIRAVLWTPMPKSAGRRVEHWTETQHFTWGSGLLLLVISAFVLGGYLGVTADVVASLEVRWRGFWAHGKRVVVRLWIFYALFELLFFAMQYGTTALWARFAIDAYYVLDVLTVWGIGLAGFFLTLTLYIVAAEDTSLLRAVTRSVSTVWRQLVVAAVLILGLAIGLQHLVLATFNLLMRKLTTPEQFLDPAATALPLLPFAILRSCLLALVTIWFCVTAFIWYRDASATKTQAAGLAG